jgi:hypothetical protein
VRGTGAVANNNGGVIYGSNMIIEIESCIFKDCFALYQGGACYVDGIINLTIKKTTFTTCEAMDLGGAIEIRIAGEDTENNYTASFESCMFDRCVGSEGGGIHCHNISC